MGKNLLNLITSSFFVFFHPLIHWLGKILDLFFLSLSRFIKGKSRAVLVVMQKHKLNMNNSCQLSKTIMSTVQLSKAKKVCGCGVASLSEKKNLDQKAINELFHHCIATDWSSFFSSSSCLGELPSQRYSFRIASSTSHRVHFFSSLLFLHSCILNLEKAFVLPSIFFITFFLGKLHHHQDRLETFLGRLSFVITFSTEIEVMR